MKYILTQEEMDNLTPKNIVVQLEKQVECLLQILKDSFSECEDEKKIVKFECVKGWACDECPVASINHTFGMICREETFSN